MVWLIGADDAGLMAPIELKSFGTQFASNSLYNSQYADPPAANLLKNVNCAILSVSLTVLSIAAISRFYTHISVSKFEINT